MDGGTGVDLSKILEGENQNNGRGNKVVITDESMDVSQLLWGTIAGLPKSLGVEFASSVHSK